MESSPLDTEDIAEKKDSDDAPETTTKKKKSAERFGVLAIESKPARPEPREHTGLLRRVVGRSEKADEPFVSPTENEDGLDEEKMLSEELTPFEEQYAEREIALARQGELRDNPEAYLEQPDGDVAAEGEVAAVEAYYDGILRRHESSRRSFSDVIASIRAPRETNSGNDVSDRVVSEAGAEQFGGRPFASGEAPGVKDESATPDTEAPATGGAGNLPPEVPPQAVNPGNPYPPQQPHVFQEFQPAVPPNRGTEDQPIEGARYTRANVAGAALIGGIVGYLIGRRRGRKKTEKKLLPVQKKLEKKVEALQHEIFNNEHKIRRAARQQSEQLQQIHHLKQEHGHEQSRAAAPEANELHGKKSPPEKIGHVLITAERPTTEAPQPALRERPQPTTVSAPSEKRPPVSSRQVEIMDRHELMELSENISVNNTTLKRIYDTHLVGERGLRRLVEAYVQGGDVKKILRQEMLEHEIDFERDPVLRDRPRSAAAPVKQSGPGLERLLERVDPTSNDKEAEEEAVLAAKTSYQEAVERKTKHRRRLIDTSFATAIVVLAVLIAILLMSRG